MIYTCWSQVSVTKIRACPQISRPVVPLKRPLGVLESGAVRLFCARDGVGGVNKAVTLSTSAINALAPGQLPQHAQRACAPARALHVLPQPAVNRTLWRRTPGP